MKKILAVMATAGLILAGCSDQPSPTPTPSSVNSPTATTEPSRVPVPTEPVTEAPATTPPAEDKTQAPATVAPSSDPGAAPPATQFAQRWGTKYPNVPEFAILKAANGTCRAIEAAGTNWNDSALTMAAIELALTTAGINGGDALEFAQDAEQNYCSSVSNPT